MEVYYVLTVSYMCLSLIRGVVVNKCQANVVVQGYLQYRTPFKKIRILSHYKVFKHAKSWNGPAKMRFTKLDC